MEKKKLDKSYAAEALDVWRIAFAGDEIFDTDFCMKFFSQDNLWEHSICWLDGGKLISTYFSLEVGLLVRNTWLSGRYIDGLATLPEYRRRGLISKCMTDDIVFCYQNGIDLMLVDPSRDSFYRHVGFEYAIDKYETSVNISYFIANDTKPECSLKVDTLAGELRGDYEAVNAWLWENSRYNEMKWPACYEDFKFTRDDIFIAISYDKDSKPKGYMLYELDSGNIYVLSIRFACLEALYALKHHIMTLPNLKYCKFLSLPPDFPLELMVKDMCRPEEAVILKRDRTRMARIINFDALLKKLSVTWPDSPVLLRIKDSILPQNDAFFLISPNGEIQRFNSGGSVPALEFITMSITDAAPLLCGMTSAAELYYSGRLSTSDSQKVSQSRHDLPEIVRMIDKILPKITTFNADEYLVP